MNETDARPRSQPNENHLNLEHLLLPSSSQSSDPLTIPAGLVDPSLPYHYVEGMQPDYLHALEFEQFPPYSNHIPREAQYFQYPQDILTDYNGTPAAMIPFPDYDPLLSQGPGPSRDLAPQFLQPSPPIPHHRRHSRSTSMASGTSSIYSASEDASRSHSPTAAEMAHWGYRNDRGSWSCAFPGCSSKTVFQRGCDLRKHYRRHTKSLFCRHAGCPQATEGGFSSKKDRARHEAKHNPQIVCEWDRCDRLFSRVDNMVSPFATAKIEMATTDT